MNDDKKEAVSPSRPLMGCASFVAYGGGVNSTAMLIEMWRRGMRPDAILFSDTGGERPETYAFIDESSYWLQDRNFPEITVLPIVSKTLEQDVLDRKTLPALAFGFKTCSQRFKTQPQDKFVNNWKLAQQTWNDGKKVIKYIGYDADEPHRAKHYESEKYENRYLLVEWDLGRADCVRICQEEGLHPSKSSCFFCPSMTKGEIKQLATSHPDLLDRALQMEANAELTNVAGLGRRFAWADVIYKEQQQNKLFDLYDEVETEMPCGCYDG